ncbi:MULTISPECIES: flagellar hook assembly protein FlgD [Oceanospirillaceae]|jgi:flagellar basal-body rod modification protein FlgD|uniref:flagellar hook assembly protein FlgD n=1 Tax=Oceanospirillaceae TaxID=135620 RepID=UPI000C53B17B|nr:MULTISPECIES: flagellar hook assembly protein FlgD [Thalassolituus]MAY14936.1 flagellar hook capping protein [Oceanospirillaceae bacterium]MCA6061879.1 flagellar hook assembly protein FlgD [Thalassolituus sp. ST750PaO-4]MCB2385245.1 flagellar hook assembly protein FlgD [Thalassolituus alkanivorans]MCB2421898.1 flagellar hook assembly protein FlgD [Thalassolituus alkanivorans]TVV45354.1 flagellar hook assembly protein FlgD [Thalassolituus sp. C2-1]
MAINEVGNNTAALDQYRKPSNSAEPKDNELGRDAFLELMVAQLNNQNPLEPTDNQAFVAQLAQFSTVEGIDKLNTTSESMMSRFNSASALQASSLVGQSVIVEGNETGLLLSGGVVSGYTEVPESASNLQLSIEDENGVLLEQIPLGNRTAGSMSVRWDGLNMMVDGEIIDIDVNKLNRQEYYKDEDGELVLDAEGNKIPVPYPAGEYVFKVTGTMGGKSEELGMQMSSRVDSVTMSGSGTVTLNLAGGRSASLDQIKQILDE